MPKDKVELPKKKMVVVEEVPSEDLNANEVPTETPVAKATITEIPQVKEEADKKEDVVSSSVQTDKTDLQEEETEKINYLWVIIPTALIVGALVGGLITYFSGISKLGSTSATPEPVVTTAPTVEVTPSPTPASTVKREELKVQILNGSGISGEAGKAKTLLEGLGYKNIDTGNASSSDFAETEIAIKTASKDALATVIKDLSSKYSAVEATKALVTTSKYDLVITIGKK